MQTRRERIGTNALKSITRCLLLISISSASYAQTPRNETERFDSAASEFITMGRGKVKAENGSLVTKDACACFGEKDWKNYKISFSARTPSVTLQAQLEFKC